MATLLDRLKVVLDMDGVGFQRGVKAAGAQADAFGKKVGTTLKQQIAGAFAVGSIIAFGRSISSTVQNIKDLSERLQLSTDVVQKLELASRTVGVGMLSIETAITKMFDGIQTGSKDSISALAALGLSAKDLEGKSFQQVFDTVVNSLLEVTESTKQAEIAFGIFGTRVGLKALHVMREMQSMKSPPMFSEKAIKDIDDAADGYTRLVRSAQAAAGGAFSAATGISKFLNNPLGVDVDLSKIYGKKREATAKAPEETFKLDYEALQSDANKWMAIQDEINKTEEDASKQSESNRVDQLTTEQRRNELLEERLKLLRDLDTFSDDKEADQLRHAQSRLGIANIDRDLIGIRPDAKTESLSFSPANSLAAIGGRASVSSGGNNPVTDELRKIREALTQYGIVLKR